MKVEFIPSYTNIADEESRAKFKDDCELVLRKCEPLCLQSKSYNIDVRARIADRYYIPFTGVYNKSNDIIHSGEFFGSVYVE